MRLAHCLPCSKINYKAQRATWNKALLSGMNNGLAAGILLSIKMNEELGRTISIIGKDKIVMRELNIKGKLYRDISTGLWALAVPCLYT